MRFDKHTQRVGFLFGLRHMLAKPWFINNIKYIQDWLRGQSNKSSTSFGVIGSLEESWRGEIDELVRKLPESVDRIVQRHSAAAPSHGFQFPILFLSRPMVARLGF